MGSVARALDILQNDKGMYMGYLLPEYPATKNGKPQ